MKKRKIYSRISRSDLSQEQALQSKARIKKSKVNLILGMVIIFAAMGSMYFYYRFNRPAQQGQAAAVWIDGKVILQKPLSATSQTIDLSSYGKAITLEIKDGKIRFIQSDCPDKICVNTGWISAPEQTAVCLPNKTSITIE